LGSDFKLMGSCAQIADQMRAEGDIVRGLATLAQISFRCWWSNIDPPTRALMIATAERFPVPEDDPRLIYILSLVGPVERGAAVLECVSRRRPERYADTNRDSKMLGIASMAVGDLVRAEQFMVENITRDRSEGLLGPLAHTLTLLAWIKILRGDWKQVGPMASESSRLADETGQTSWIDFADLAASTVAAYRGEIAMAEALAASAEKALLPRGAISALAWLEHARGAAALAESRHEEAYQHLRRIFDPASGAYHAHVRSWVLVALVEAASVSA